MDPEATAGVLKGQWHALFHSLRKMLAEKLIPYTNCKCRIILQECPQDIGLVPKPLPLQNPFGMVFEGVMDVVKVNEYTFGKSRDYLEQNVVKVTTDFGHMR